MTPRRKRYGERSVVAGVKTSMAPWCDAIYTTEVGGRNPSSRGTAGFPDLYLMVNDPIPYELTVEAKGRHAKKRDEQWLYTLRAMQRGQAHLMVLSAEELWTGLLYLGLLPRRWRTTPPMPWDAGVWPENVNYLRDMRRNFWNRQPKAHFAAAGVTDQGAPAYTTALLDRLRVPEDWEPHNGRRRTPPYPLERGGI